FLVRLLEEAAISSRIAGATGLGRMRDQGALEPLLKLAVRKGEPPQVRAAAVAALGFLAQKSSFPPLARVAIDSHYGLQNECIDEIATRAGSLMKTTEEGGTQRVR